MVSRRGVRLFRMEQPIVLFSKFVPSAASISVWSSDHCKGGHAHWWL